jgi:aerobic carbon-monoxide dehydrogenase large subunit
MDAETAVNRARRGPRIEDDYLVRGAGRFVADAPEDGQTYAAFVRSPHACARIVSIDVTEAKGGRGVVAVLTARDMDAAGVGNVGRHAPLSGRGGNKLIMPGARSRHACG